MSVMTQLSKWFSPAPRPAAPPPTDAEQFQAQLAGLLPEERRRRLETRQRYEQFARRQRITEAETQADALRYHSS